MGNILKIEMNQTSLKYKPYFLYGSKVNQQSVSVLSSFKCSPMMVFKENIR